MLVVKEALYEMFMPAMPLVHMPFKISSSPKAKAVVVVRSFCFLAKENS